MAKMINADELIEFCNTERAMLHAHNNSVACAALRRVVEFAKEYAVEAEPVKHGRWILCDDGYVRCSECNRKAFIENDETILTDFCHGCGADMRMDGDYYVYTLS